MISLTAQGEYSSDDDDDDDDEDCVDEAILSPAPVADTSSFTEEEESVPAVCG